MTRLGVLTLEPDTAIDPVCGMTVTIDAEALFADVDGERVYFCCPALPPRLRRRSREVPAYVSLADLVPDTGTLTRATRRRRLPRGPQRSRPRCSARSGSRSRCCSRARPASGRRRRRSPSPSCSTPRCSDCSASRASTPRRRSTSGTTRGSCSASGSPRPAATASRRSRCSGRTTSSGGPCSPRSSTPGPRPAVLLIDEIDRADEEFEAFLFELLAESTVTIPEIGTLSAAHPPIVILTSNRTRDLHDALKRRCLYHWIEYPPLAQAVAIVRARVPEASADLATQVAGAVQRLRSLDVQKPPGVAEAIDWVHAAHAARADDRSTRRASRPPSGRCSSTARTTTSPGRRACAGSPTRCGPPARRASDAAADGHR